MIDRLKHFFSPLTYFSENAPYSFGLEHIIFVTVVSIAIILITVLLRKLEHKKIRKVYMILWAIQVVLEFTKITWYTIVHGRFFYEYLIPIHICSLFMYIMPFVLWGKGLVKKSAIAFIATFGFLGGLVNFIVPSVLNDFPIFSFGGLHSMFFHCVMVFVAVWMWTSKFYKPQIKDCLNSFIILLIFSIPVIVVDKVFNLDYMFFNGGFGTPFTILSSTMPQWVWTFVILVLYFASNFLIFYLPIILTKFFKTKKIIKNKT